MWYTLNLKNEGNDYWKENWREIVFNTHEKTVELNRFCSEVDVGRVNRGTNNEPSFFDEKWSLEKICRLAVNADKVTVKRRWMNKAESDSVLISDGNNLFHSRESIVENDMINVVVQMNRWN